MKRIVMFLLMACLMGGLTVNANAQRSKSRNGTTAPSGTTEVILKSYESAVDRCTTYYTENTKIKGCFHLEEYTNLYKKAVEFKRKLEKNKASFTPSQLSRFNEKTASLGKYPTPEELTRAENEKNVIKEVGPKERPKKRPEQNQTSNP